MSLDEDDIGRRNGLTAADAMRVLNNLTVRWSVGALCTVDNDHVTVHVAITIKRGRRHEVFYTANYLDPRSAVIAGAALAHRECSSAS